MDNYGIKWTEVNRREQLVGKQKFFETEAQLQAFVNKLENRDNFIRIEAWLGEGLI